MTYLVFSTRKPYGLVNTALPDSDKLRAGPQALLMISVFPQNFPHPFLGLRWFLFIVMAVNQSLLHRSYY